jgi:hypothetical protein
VLFLEHEHSQHPQDKSAEDQLCEVQGNVIDEMGVFTNRGQLVMRALPVVVFADCSLVPGVGDHEGNHGRRFPERVGLAL